MILDPDLYGLLPLSESNPKLINNFICKKKDLNDFFHQEAYIYQHSRIGSTTCVFHVDCPDRIIAFFTLSNSGVKVTGIEFLELGINITTKLQFIPAVLIGRFAVDDDYDECGNGRNILELAISSVIEEFKVSATRLIVVDAAADVEGFYRKCGFIKSLDAEKKARNHGSNSIKMYKDIMST